ncbi:molybdate-anion transporter-like [Heracleum sosnowskyi]|uniref:Molybdate-anion transporter-like n=1 Tax=Heracleum sosnowskyi TaxID=360622 RepID=A0AAD8HCT8_9APIA|nr:molybdate-anion transporter-like [Heracleum sosnowskyi]
MGVVIETEVWFPNHSIFIFIFISCLLSILCFSHFKTNHTNTNTSSIFDQSFPPSLTTFLLCFSISSVLEGLGSVPGEYELAYYGLNREQMVLSLCVGYAASLFIAPLLGVFSDLIGHKRICLTFCILHLFVGVWKRITSHPNIWLASICLGLANSIFSFSFETWLVVEHDKLGHRQDMLNDMFWLMAFLKSACFIGSQVIANWLVGNLFKQHVGSLSTATVLLAILSIISVTRGRKEPAKLAASKDYQTSFYSYVLCDKRIWLLIWAQACVQFSVAAFWILWAPTVVADGREVHLGLIYPCLLGAGMLGSTFFPWFVSGLLSLRTEDCLLYAFSVAGIVLSVVAYDYQEIGVLVTLFCLFHACVGLILPSLARLRTLYVPNELRGGMMSLSLVPVSAAILFFLMQGGYYRNIENSTIIAFAAVGLFSAAGSMYLLKQWGKQLHNDWHKM